MFLTIATTIVRATYYYDGDRNVISQTDANGNIVFQKQFDPYDRLTRETDALRIIPGTGYNGTNLRKMGA